MAYPPSGKPNGDAINSNRMAVILNFQTSIKKVGCRAIKNDGAPWLKLGETTRINERSSEPDTRIDGLV